MGGTEKQEVKKPNIFGYILGAILFVLMIIISVTSAVALWCLSVLGLIGPYLFSGGIIASLIFRQWRWAGICFLLDVVALSCKVIAASIAQWLKDYDRKNNHRGTLNL